MRAIIGDVTAMLRAHPDIGRGKEAHADRQLQQLRALIAGLLHLHLHKDHRLGKVPRHRRTCCSGVYDIIRRHDADISFPQSTLHIYDGALA